MAFDVDQLPEFGVSDAYCIECGGKGTATVNLRIEPRKDGRRPAVCKACWQAVTGNEPVCDWLPRFKDRGKR